MAGYTRNDTADNIADGKVINASDLDGEFNAVQAAFDATTGHTHDGTTGGGAAINWSNIANKPDPTITLSGDVSGSATMTDLGNITITTTVADDSHSHSYLPLSGGTLTGQLDLNFADAKIRFNDTSGSPTDQSMQLRAESIDTGLPGSEGVGLVLETTSTNGSPDTTPAFIVTGEIYAGNSTVASTNKVWHAGNDGSGSGLDADLLDGLHLNPDTRNDSANVVVRTDGNGYTNFGWINTTSGNTTSTLTDIYVNTNDGYIRKATPAHFRSQITDAYYAPASHTHDDRYYTESEIQTFFNRGYVSGYSAANLPVGWYTIATNTGNRALGEFQIWDTASSDHQSVLFNASHHYGTDGSNDITVLANSRFGGTNFRYIRIKEGGTYDGAALQVYIDGSTNNVNVAITGANAQESGWVLKNWISDSTDPSDVSWASLSEKTIVDLDQVVNGGIITTGDIYAGGQTAQYSVWHAGNDGSGSGLDADLLDGQHASAFASASHSHSYLPLSGGTMSGDIIISKADAKIRLYDSTGTTGNNPAVEWDTTANQGISLSLNVYDGELPQAGYGMVFGPSTTNTQWPSTGNLSLSVLGEIYAGSEDLSTVNLVWHAGNDGSGSGLDADLLDGQHASNFASSSHTHSLNDLTDASTDSANFRIAIGNGASYSTSYGNQLAVGDSASTAGADATAIGVSAYTTGSSALAVGTFAAASPESTSLGPEADASGTWTVAVGKSSSAIGNYSNAFGRNAYASGNETMSFGTGSTATALGSSSFGFSADATGSYSTAISANAVANSSYGTAVGYSSDATNTYTTAIGSASVADYTYGTTLGYGADIGGNHATALGSYTDALANAVAVGHSTFSYNYGTGVGYNATSGEYGVALGNGANSYYSGSFDYGIAIGYSSNVDAAYGIGIGNSTYVHSTASYGVAIGSSAASTAFGAISLGVASDATHRYSIALGHQTQTSFISDVSYRTYSNSAARRGHLPLWCETGTVTGSTKHYLKDAYLGYDFAVPTNTTFAFELRLSGINTNGNPVTEKSRWVFKNIAGTVTYFTANTYQRYADSNAVTGVYFEISGANLRFYYYNNLVGGVGYNMRISGTLDYEITYQA